MSAADSDLDRMDALLRAEGAGALRERVAEFRGPDVSDRVHREIEAVVRVAAATLNEDPDHRPNSCEIQAVAPTPGGGRALCAARHWTVVSGHHRWAVDTATVRVWDLDGEPVGRVLTQHSDNVVGFQRGGSFPGVAISADGHFGAAVGDDGTLQTWDLDTGAAAGAFTADGRLRICAFSADGRTVAAAGVTGDVHVLRLMGPRTGEG